MGPGIDLPGKVPYTGGISTTDLIASMGPGIDLPGKDSRVGHVGRDRRLQWGPG